MKGEQHAYLKIKYTLARILAGGVIVVLSPLLLMLFILVSVDTFSYGIFVQDRVGQYGKLFRIYKFKTIRPVSREISNVGAFLRKTKLDELPQLFNILKGEMSFIGPRPDVPGYYDGLKGEDRKVLILKPGLLSEASLEYRNEEYLLNQKENPLKYNDEVIFPHKIKLNLEYLERVSFKEDIRVLLKAIITFFNK
ncbi:sugar transferase [Riemerella anatipestifer]|uniref:sugar transferase n=1 Tax=Riemerella anatipestifer TaxID=34085 RepID=UPI0007ED4677|nr:sugar transferase [Riemerella anatipestifer]MBT0573007.1 sugar transferase [Riemerella anatipestifer]MCU7573712.1 sugar transferase [Riemerella anatipestifer]MCU7594872.1 sugar transferase [Riemerella anatipestifer]MCW0486115.1 sugar transferase [Riemerella anatipestifer]MCW0489203.1 sugar transferase [Riemerella anatipestifer]